MKVNAFRNAATVALSVAFAGVMFAQSQTPQTPPRPPSTTPQTSPPTQPPGQTSNMRSLDGQTVTVTGCLAQEKDVAGQTPNVAERAGVGPDYILTNVQMRSASPSAGGGAGATGAPGTTKPPAGAPGATAGTTPSGAAGSMNVKLKEVDNDQMRSNLNKRIEVTGRFQAAPAGATGATGAAQSAARGGGSNQPLPEVHVTNVRVLDQPCTPQQ